ncbi:MAG: sodium:proton antiporter, partial [Ignavibacteria bacterium]|nr:sodium:proton antiporter [Ignavibacteria bacterium]
MKTIFRIVFIIILLGFAASLYASSDSASSVNQVVEATSHDIFKNPPPIYAVIPFVLLLLMISTGPLFYKHFWERNYPKISIALGLIVVIYYLIIRNDTKSLVHTLEEYLSFIALLTSLFVASGGILIKIDKRATPIANTILLLFGAVISNFIGTTGASM